MDPPRAKRPEPIDVNAALASVGGDEEGGPEEVNRNATIESESATPASDSTGAVAQRGDGPGMLDAFQAQLAKGPAPSAGAGVPRRVARRQQQAEVAQVPLVKKAIELFEVELDKVRYTPPPSGG
jgi:hypothetical protein